MDWSISPLRLEDTEALLQLHWRVATISGGIIRSAAEIDLSYMTKTVVATVEKGLGFCVRSVEDPALIFGAIHAYRSGPQAFRHILADLTIVVDPEWQGRGLGRLLFSSFMESVQNSLPDILRVELFVRENHKKAIRLYESFGFVQEGVQRHKIYNQEGKLEL